MNRVRLGVLECASPLALLCGMNSDGTQAVAFSAGASFVPQEKQKFE